MKKFIYIIFILIFSNQLSAHIPHYDNISSINMEIYRNNKLIGYSNFVFDHSNERMVVKNLLNLMLKFLEIPFFIIK